VIFAFVVVFFIVIMAAAYQTSQSKPKEPADEYFDILDAQYLGTPKQIGKVKGISLSELRFKIRAVKGDAHNVYAQSGYSDWAEGIATPPDIQKGQNATVYLTGIGMDIYVDQETGDFGVEVQISCSEANGVIFVPLEPKP